MAVFYNRIRNLKLLPVEELKEYLQEEMTLLENRMEDTFKKNNRYLKWMPQLKDELEKGMQYLNVGDENHVHSALNITSVFLSICAAENRAKPHLVLRVSACSNPYLV